MQCLKRPGGCPCPAFLQAAGEQSEAAATEHGKQVEALQQELAAAHAAAKAAEAALQQQKEAVEASRARLAAAEAEVGSSRAEAEAAAGQLQEAAATNQLLEEALEELRCGGWRLRAGVALCACQHVWPPTRLLYAAMQVAPRCHLQAPHCRPKLQSSRPSPSPALIGWRC